VSITAISWALRQEIARSSEKFVLVCMCNYADELGVCYPSVATLERDTAQDRKTVIGNIHSLIGAGLLKDTGRRVGPTRGVIVYQIVGIPESSKYHYVYKLTDLATGQFYIGKRSCSFPPDVDTYRGSGRWTKEMAAKGVSLHREILAEFSSNEQAIAEEQRQFQTYDNDPLCMNDGLPSRLREKCNNGPYFGTGSKNGTVPKSPPSSTVFPSKQSQKRDTEPSEEPSEEPKTGIVVHESLPLDVWEEWLAHRREKRWTMSPRALKPQLKLLAKYDTETQREIIETSMQSGWQGLFAPKGKSKPREGQQWM
jgi:hypothetical protein